MKQIRVGIGEYDISRDEKSVIMTYSLGSCVAVVVYDKMRRTAGMMHIALPDSSINTGKAKQLPGYFVDTGLPLLLKEMNWISGAKHLWIKLVGGASIMDDNHHFEIGKRNLLAIKKYLWHNRLGISGEEVGGSISRTVCVSVDSGEVLISSKGKKWTL